MRRFRVKVAKVAERDLPAARRRAGQEDRRADGGLRSATPWITDFAGLRADVTQRLEHEKVHQVRARQEQAMLEQLRERHPIELPEGVVEEETERPAPRVRREPGAPGASTSRRCRSTGTPLAREVRPQAERRVHVRLVLDAVAEANAIELAPEELEERLALIARGQRRTTSSVRQALGAERSARSSAPPDAAREDDRQPAAGERRAPSRPRPRSRSRPRPRP